MTFRELNAASTRVVLILAMMSPAMACSSAAPNDGEEEGESSAAVKGGCATGLTKCKGQCVDLQSDANNCGACRNVCGTDNFCGAATCAPTNKGILLLKVHVINDNDGTNVASDVGVLIQNGNPNAFSGSESGTPVILSPGIWHGTTTALAGYSESQAAICTTAIGPGAVQVCTLTFNDFAPP